MIWKPKQPRRNRKQSAADSGRHRGLKRRGLKPETLEARRLMAADPIHVGVVYLETDYLETDQDVGGDSQGDRFILSFTGGAPDTELSELRIRTDKDGDGISVGDPIYDTAPGGRGKDGSHDFQIVRVITSDGRSIDARAEVEDGGQELVLRLSNFKSGDRLEFTLDVDEVLRNSIDLEVFNNRLDVITSGQEFQDSILEATFNAPHYETSNADAIFENDYGDPASSTGLNLPPDESEDIDSRPNRSAAAVGSVVQVPKPIDISGHVWVDNDLDQVREAGEPLLEGVQLSLWTKDASGRFVDTGHRSTTNSQGRYSFGKSLGLLPGTYQVAQTQPEGFYSVAAVPGSIDGARSGEAASPDVLTGIEIPLGDSSAVNYDFAEAQAASLSGFVYVDLDNDGRRDDGEVGIAGVRVQVIPINTISQGSALTVTTAADGSYAFTGLAPGSYEVVEVSQPLDYNDGIDSAGTVDGLQVGAAINPGDRIVGVELGGNDNGIEYNFGETPFGSISGFVYLAAPGEDCDGVHDGPGNTPIPGVLVELQTETGQVITSTTTGALGGYSFDDIPVGSYRIVEHTPFGLIDGGSHVGRIGNVQVGNSVDGGLISEITMTPGGVGVQYNFCEGTPATLSGFVYHDQSNDGIRDSNEQPIPDTVVSLLDSNGSIVATTNSDSEGRYEFTNLQPGDYQIVESQPDGFLDGIDTVGNVRGQQVGRDSGSDTFTGITLKQGDVGVEYNFGELLPASLSGRVHVDIDDDCEFDEGEELLSGVIIRLFDSEGNQVRQTTTDSNGQYTFAGLVPGVYTVVEEQPEGLFEGGTRAGSAGGVVDGPDANGNSRISEITLESGENAVQYDFCEQPPAEISGNVFADRDEDCVFDADEPGLEGVLVELFDADGKLIGSTRTDASGNYRFTGLRAGNYTLRETQPAGYLQGSQTAGNGGGDDSVQDVISRIAIGWGDRLTDYNFCELEPSSISGVVHVDGNGDCIHDDDEPLLAGVVIQLRDNDGKLVDATTTDSDGRYTFDNLRPGDYQVFEQQPDGFFHGGQTVGTGLGQVLGIDLLGITLSANQDVINYNFCELPPASISGSVWQEIDLNRRFDAGESPIPGVLVELLNESGETIQQTQTDTEGNYRFDSLAPGVYGIRENQPAGLFHGGQLVGSAGGNVQDDDLIVGITLLGGKNSVNYDFPEVPPAQISGFVFQDGEAIVTDNEISAEELREFRDGLRTQDDTPLSDVTLELRNILGQPVDASRALTGSYQAGPIRVTTDADGFYEFVGLRPGTYHVYQVQPEDYTDSLDTAGSTGGIAVNPADVLVDSDRIVVQTLAASEATNPNDDAILNITLQGGQTSVANNFSEVLITPPEDPPLFVPPPANPEPPPAVFTPIEQFDQNIRLITFAEPLNAPNRVYQIDEWAVSWHLSVINGGINRGTLGADGKIQAASAKQMKQDWGSGSHDGGKWMIADKEGNRTDQGDGFNLGGEDAVALAGDFDGDGIDEAAIFVGGQWFVDLNGNGRWDAGDLWVSLGTKLDRPVVGDWDGDGKDDVGIFGRRWQRDEQKIKRDPGLPDPDNKRRREVDARTVAHRSEDQVDDRKRLMLRGDNGALKADAVDHVFQYGEQVDTPIAGDWNGDGIDQIAVFRNGSWLLDADGDGRWTDADEKVKYGRVGDEPVVGDFNGDDIDEIGVVRGDTWIIDTDGDRRITGNDMQIQVPRSGENSQPVVGDFDGDGKDEPGYYDEAA